MDMTVPESRAIPQLLGHLLLDALVEVGNAGVEDRCVYATDIEPELLMHCLETSS